jgi:TolA-binding protein
MKLLRRPLFEHRRWHLPLLVLHSLLLLTVAFVLPPRRRLCVLSTSSSSSSSSSNNNDDDNLPLYDVATQLLNLVLNKRDDEIIKNTLFDGWIKRRRRNTTSSSSSYENQKLQQQQQQSNHNVENLIERLTRPTIDIIEEQEQEQEQEQKQDRKGNIFNRNNIQSSSLTTTPPTYDPTESLFDCGFFCTLYWYYPNNNNNNNNNKIKESEGNAAPKEKEKEKEKPPIWAKLSLLPSNIKGQQYYLSNNFQQSVINYSEIYGKNIHIKAEGTLYPISSNTNTNNGSSSSSGSDDTLSSSPLSSSSSSSSPVVVLKNSRKLRTTLPDIFRVDATKIILSIFGLTINFSIKGSANLVVLYADPRIRIFVSPMESRSVVGNWEEAGLVVVQVRSDLVSMLTTTTNNNNIQDDEANNNISKVIDFR